MGVIDYFLGFHKRPLRRCPIIDWVNVTLHNRVGEIDLMDGELNPKFERRESSFWDRTVIAPMLLRGITLETGDFEDAPLAAAQLRCSILGRNFAMTRRLANPTITFPKPCLIEAGSLLGLHLNAPGPLSGTFGVQFRGWNLMADQVPLIKEMFENDPR